MNDQIAITFMNQFNEAVSALIELESMKVANQEQILNNESLVYNEQAFLDLQSNKGLNYNSEKFNYRT